MNKHLSKKCKYTRLADCDNDIDDTNNHSNGNLLLVSLQNKTSKKKEEKDKQKEEKAYFPAKLIDFETSSLNQINKADLFNSNQSFFELKQRYSEKVKPKKLHSYFKNFIIYQIEKNDTLQKIALKCHCSINELKRFNNLVSDQDFYALRYLKIPIVKYGLLSEVLDHQANRNSKSQNAPSSFSSSSSSNTLVINVGLKKTFQCDQNNQDMENFLLNLDKDLKEIRKTTDNYKYLSNESLLPVIQSQQTIVKSAYYCDGADCGLHWLNVCILTLIIFVLLPVIYAFVITNHNFN